MAVKTAGSAAGLHLPGKAARRSKIGGSIPPPGAMVSHRPLMVAVRQLAHLQCKVRTVSFAYRAPNTDAQYRRQRLHDLLQSP